MIELNKKAKIFNPAEDVVGSELFWIFRRIQLVGSHYYMKKPKAGSGKDVLALSKANKWPQTLKAVEDAGWRNPVELNPNFIGWEKDGNSLYLTAQPWSYDNFRVATEVCKLMFWDKEEVSHEMVKGIHKIVMEDFFIKEFNGDQVTLQKMHNHDEPEPQAIPQALWNPPPVDVMQGFFNNNGG